MKKPILCGRNHVNTPDDDCNDCARLNERLTALERCCEEIRAWKDTIDAWKDGISVWQNTVNAWKDGIDAWKSTIESRFQAINTWQNTINSWRNTVDTWTENIDQNGYNALSNKPKINGITVEGNKSSEDYLIRAISTVDVDALTPIECYEPPVQTVEYATEKRAV